MADNKENVLVYNVKVNTKDGQTNRKAIDLLGLKQFLEERMSRFSVFNMQIDKIEQDDKIYPFIARAALSVLGELEDSVNSALGVGQDSVAEPELMVPQPAQPTTPETIQPTQPMQPVVATANEVDDKIVL